MRRMPVLIGSICTALLGAAVLAQNPPTPAKSAATTPPAAGTSAALPPRLLNGEAQMSGGNYSFAESMFADLLRDPGLSPSVRPRVLRDLGTSEAENGEPENAITHFSEALRLNPRDSSIYTARGNAYRRIGKQKDAIADYTQALKVNPQDSDAFLHRGMAYSARGDTNRALADYDAAISLAPNLTPARTERGLALLSRGEYDRAIADFDVLVRLQPTVEQNFFNRANAFRYRKDFVHAIADYSEALRLKPSNAWALTNRAICSLRLHDFEHARDDYKFALQINPANKAVHQQLAMTYYLLGDYANSMAEFNTAATSGTDETLSIISDSGTLDPSDQYAMIWEFFARMRTGQDGVKHLKDVAARLKEAPWPAPVLNYLSGDLPGDQLLATTRSGSAETQRNRGCEVHSYMGEMDSIRNQNDTALRELRQAQQECPVDYDETNLAWAGVRRITGAPVTAAPASAPRPASSQGRPR